MEETNPVQPDQPVQPEQPDQPVQQFDTSSSPEGTRPDTATEQEEVSPDKLASDGDDVVEGVEEGGEASPSEA